MTEPMKISELTGGILDYWVAKATEEIHNLVIHNGRVAYEQKFDPEIHCHDSCQDMMKCWTYYHPSSDWSQFGPLIEKYRVELNIGHTGNYSWLATIFDYQTRDKNKLIIAKQRDMSPLVAACRCIVASKYGDTVDDRTMYTIRQYQAFEWLNAARP